MPSAAPSIRSCGCVMRPGEMCEHVLARRREYKARFDAKRPNFRERGYTAQWDVERREFLDRHPFCAHLGCTALATVVDHVIPHRGDMRLFWDKTNWQSLC